MGTSNSYGGPGSGTPLVPTWLDQGASTVPGTPASPQGDGGDGSPPSSAPPISDLPISPPPIPNRFSTARTNFSRFAGSGGSDRASLGRAVSDYVAKASGGARQAAIRMGSSRRSGERLLGFLSNAAARGTRETLRALDLEHLAGRPIDEVFLGLADYVCPDGGTVDEGIARDAFIETIADLADNGITNLDILSVDQMQTVFELYATHAIEARLCNDIGANTILFPRDVRAAGRVQAQLHDFIRRGVSDALTAARSELQGLAHNKVLGFVNRVYERAFTVLRSLGETWARER